MKWIAPKACPACGKSYLLSSAAAKHWNNAHAAKHGAYLATYHLWSYTEQKSSSHASKAPVAARSRSSAYEVWGLDDSLDLNRYTADFYLLMSLCNQESDQMRGAYDYLCMEKHGVWPSQLFTVRKPGEFREREDHFPDDRLPRYQEIRNYLTTQFAAYLDMVVGGEIRHAAARPSVLSETAKPLRDALKRTGGIPLPADRATCWWYWRRFRERHGTVALQWVSDCYAADDGWGGGGYGGHKWKQCTDALLWYEQKKIPGEVFVDLAFSLEHNGGSVFNKVWGSVDKTLLDAKFEGDYDVLLPHASASVRALYTAPKPAYNPHFYYRLPKTGIWIQGD
jgi:hypothetical protein